MALKHIVFCLVVSLPFLKMDAHAQSLSNIPGAFSESGFGSRPSGMGQAFTAISDDANAFLTNPAGLLLGPRKAFTANYAELFGLIPSGYFGLLYPLTPTYAIGGGFMFLGDDALMENTLGVSFAFTFRNVPIGKNEIYFDQMAFGVTLKGRWATFGNNADGGPDRVTGTGRGFSIDLGYMLFINENLRLGLTLRDLVNRFNWDSSASGTYNEGVPATLRFGGAYFLNGVTIAFDLRKALHSDTANRTYFGIEKTFLQTLILRAGFSNNLGTADLNRRWSFGATLLRGVFENYTIGMNASYRVDDIDNLLRFGLDVAWGQSKKQTPGRVY
ncbi:MAG: hypothetical protein ACE5G1_03810 [bacterium]